MYLHDSKAHLHRVALWFLWLGVCILHIVHEYRYIEWYLKLCYSYNENRVDFVYIEYAYDINKGYGYKYISIRNLFMACGYKYMRFIRA